VSLNVPVRSSTANSSEQSCNGVLIGQKAVFEVSVELHQCTSEPQTFYLNAGAYGQTTVIVEPICNCSCEELAVSIHSHYVMHY
jgi:hypothetical protein